MEYNYDVIVVGAGPTGIFTCYELKEKNPKLKILLVDKGLDIYSRKCPILDKKINKCPVNREGVSGCYPACSITNGFGGAGAYSDGKFNITSEFGGWMTEYMERNQVEELIKYANLLDMNLGISGFSVQSKYRWIEYRGDNYRFDSIYIFNDSIPSDIITNEDLEQMVSDYKSSLREDKLNELGIK
jgi:uncharacterized FAD-dependent dehydrogenase